jgi:hypothetical protein
MQIVHIISTGKYGQEYSYVKNPGAELVHINTEIRVVQQQRSESETLDESLELAELISSQNQPHIHGDGSQSGNSQFAADNNYCNPAAYITHVAEHDKGGTDKQFICQRIEKFTQISNLIATPGDIAVKKVGQRCQKKDKAARNMVSLFG